MASYGIRTPQVKATGNNSCSHMPQPSVFKDVRACRLPALERLKPSRKPFPRNWQFSKMLEPPASLSQATGNNSRSHAPAIWRAFEPAVCPPSNASNPPASFSQATVSQPRSSHLFLRAFEPAACPPSNAPARPFPGNWQFLKTLEPERLKPSSQASGKFLRTFEPAVCPPSNASNVPAAFPRQLATTLAATPQPSVSTGLQACRLPAPRTPQTIPQAFPRQLATTTLAATCSSHMFLRAFEPQVTYFFGDSQVLWCCVWCCK